MTEENHCYENAMAECVNGILKDQSYLDQTFTNTAHAKIDTENAINLYNAIRLHLSLDLKHRIWYINYLRKFIFNL